MEYADRNLYLNADKSKVVEEGDPESAFVLAGEGGLIPQEYRDLPGIEAQKSTKKNADAEEADTKAVSDAPADKAVKPAANKSRSNK